MEDKEKSRHTVWLSDEAWKLVERMYKDDNCPTRNEFVEKAIRFYDGYLHTSRASAFLPKVLLDVLEGSLGVYCGRVGKLLFNLAVEHSITNHLLAADVDMTREEYNKMRGGSVREVNSTRGTISLKDVIQEGNYD